MRKLYLLKAEHGGHDEHIVGFYSSLKKAREGKVIYENSRVRSYDVVIVCVLMDCFDLEKGCALHWADELVIEK